MTNLQLDEWQQKVLETQGNICLRSGRQVGKSTVIAIKAANYAISSPSKSIMIISATERQSFLLFSKVLAYITDNHKKMILSGKDRPTKTEIKLKNKSVIRCLPTGLNGIGIRGYTVDVLIADEAAFIPEDVWSAVTPMLATTKGQIILLSTPHGREGFYYRCFSDPSFTSFHISSEDCPRVDKEFLKREKESKSRLVYTQEYLGEFVDELLQFFPDNLIRSVMTSKRPLGASQGDYFLGVDVARQGGDDSTFEILRMLETKNLVQVENIVTTNTRLTDTTRMVLELEKKWNFNKIYIDDGGLGAGVFDQLLEDESTRRKTIPINNARRELEHLPQGDRKETRKKTLMKEALYANLLALMEHDKIQLLDDPEIFLSLKSVQFEYNDNHELKIYGNYTHIVEGLIRAAWSAKEKNLSIWIKSF